MKTHKVEPLIIASVGLFWCFLVRVSTAAFGPGMAVHYHLNIKALVLPRIFGTDDHRVCLRFGVIALVIAADTFAAVASLCASLFRSFAGYVSDLFRRNRWAPLPFSAAMIEAAYPPLEAP